MTASSLLHRSTTMAAVSYVMPPVALLSSPKIDQKDPLLRTFSQKVLSQASNVSAGSLTNFQFKSFRASFSSLDSISGRNYLYSKGNLFLVNENVNKSWKKKSFASGVISASVTVASEDAVSAADFCGPEGVILNRPKDLSSSEKNGKHYHVHTFGCQMNMADSERMAGILETMGYTHSEDANKADVLVYNTCSIRDRSEQKVYSALGRQRARKRRDPNLKIIVAGCVAQQEGETLLRRVPEVDLVMGPQHANRLQELLEQVDLGSQVCAIEPIHIEEDISKPRRYKEVTLLGQNIDAYGRDLGGSAPDGSGRRLWTLTDLLHYVHDVPGIERIRFATSHVKWANQPRYFTERLIRACAELPKVCKYFHIPFQSGDNTVLKAMNRGYTRERYSQIISMVRSYMPDAAVSADVIVGFPGETEEQFQNTLGLLNDIRFDQVNTAAYSPRPNTPAALWEDQVADLIKMDRLQRINRLVLEHSDERNQRYLGRVESVLVEGPNPRPGFENQMMGRTDTNRLTFFPGGPELVGKIVNVRITEARQVSLSGELV